jgi:hypothetical protein
VAGGDRDLSATTCAQHLLAQRASRNGVNPIENGFSKIKSKLRAAAKGSVTELEDCLDELSGALSHDIDEANFDTADTAPARPDREPH